MPSTGSRTSVSLLWHLADVTVAYHCLLISSAFFAHITILSSLLWGHWGPRARLPNFIMILCLDCQWMSYRLPLCLRPASLYVNSLSTKPCWPAFTLPTYLKCHHHCHVFIIVFFIIIVIVFIIIVIDLLPLQSSLNFSFYYIGFFFVLGIILPFSSSKCAV
jgi:hypothetical protein